MLTVYSFHSHFTDEEKKQGWVRVVAPVSAEDVILEREASGPAPVQSDLTLHATMLPPGTSRPHKFPGSGTGKKAYVQVIQTSGYNTGPSTGATIKIGDGKGTEQILKEGDGAYLLGEGGHELKVENMGEKVAEVLLFDL
jgi:quercetin 2,3-dioxygenase